MASLMLTKSAKKVRTLPAVASLFLRRHRELPEIELNRVGELCFWCVNRGCVFRVLFFLRDIKDQFF
jgi:hypothetical protein